MPAPPLQGSPSLVIPGVEPARAFVLCLKSLEAHRGEHPEKDDVHWIVDVGDDAALGLPGDQCVEGQQHADTDRDLQRVTNPIAGCEEGAPLTGNLSAVEGPDGQ